MKYSCHILTKLLVSHNVSDVIISPGSRNSPLITAVDATDRLCKFVIIDERAAAFFALGRSQIMQRPTVLICTSGTAVLNYAPAIAEAFYQGIPLIVISADRPKEWIDQDDSQTIRQYEVLSNIVKASYDIPDLAEPTKEDEWYAGRIINEAILNATSGKPGPVHINMQFKEPLQSNRDNITHTKTITDVLPSGHISPSIIKNMANGLTDKKVLIVAGFHNPDWKLNKALNILASLPNVAVLAESISNLHGGEILTNIDRILVTIKNQLSDYRPDIVITYGGALISRMVKSFLREFPASQHWHVGLQPRISDCFQSLTKRICTSAEMFFPAFANALKKYSKQSSAIGYNALWKKASVMAESRHNSITAAAPWCSLKAFDIIMKHLPHDFNLQLSNGTSVRYAQLTNNSHIHATYCNRGVSGIDGSTSTAIGASTCYEKSTILITGDLSFAYDIGALANPYIPENFKIVVINNKGGGIFRFIGSTTNLPQREAYFCVPPILPICKLAEAYRFTYFKAESEEELKNTIQRFITSHSQKSILEIVVPELKSAEILNKYFTI